MLALQQVNWHTTQLRIADEITPRRERAYSRGCRWTTYGIKTQRFWHSACCNLSLLLEFLRFGPRNARLAFNVWNMLGPSPDADNGEIAQCSNRIQPSVHSGPFGGSRLGPRQRCDSLVANRQAYRLQGILQAVWWASFDSFSLLARSTFTRRSSTSLVSS
jgi:hypothetical protein